MMDKDELNKLLRDDWNIQGFLATPLYIGSCAYSGITMEKYFPFRYNAFLLTFKNDYCEMYYNVNDLKRIWFKLSKEYKKYNTYFMNIRKKHVEIFNSFIHLRNKVDSLNFKDVDAKEFFELFNKAVEMTIESVGIAHIIEAFSMLNDRVLRHKVKEVEKNEKKINKYSEILSQPVKNSWINDNDQELFNISKITDKKKQQRLLEQHAKDYYWIRSNYVNGVPLTALDFKKELKEIKDYTPTDPEKIKKEKQELIKELKLDHETVSLIHHIEFFMSFQDERKKNILISVHYLQKFVDELERRYRIKKETAKYLLLNEVTQEFIEQKNINDILKERRRGCFIVLTKDKKLVYTGKELEEIEKIHP